MESHKHLNSGRETILTLIYLPLVVSEPKAAERFNQDGNAVEWMGVSRL